MFIFLKGTKTHGIMWALVLDIFFNDIQPYI